MQFLECCGLLPGLYYGADRLFEVIAKVLLCSCQDVVGYVRVLL